MLSPELRESFQFHLNMGGYCTPPGRAACALQAAKKEKYVKENPDKVRIRWVPDEAYSSFGTYQEDKWAEWEARKLDRGEFVAEGCIVEVRCPKCGQWSHHDSLWGIVTDGSDRQHRVFEASMGVPMEED